MARHVILVLTDPVDGREDDYNKFYNETHMPEFVELKGVVSGQRFVVSHPGSNVGPPHRYLTIYEIEGSLDEARAALLQDAANLTPAPEVFGEGSEDWWFTAITERVSSKP
jgi:hypothetical protein